MFLLAILAVVLIWVLCHTVTTSGSDSVWIYPIMTGVFIMGTPTGPHGS